MEGAFGFSKMWVGSGPLLLCRPGYFCGLTVNRTLCKSDRALIGRSLTLLQALVVMVMHITRCPGVLTMIIKSAFGLEGSRRGEAAGSVTAAMLNGIQARPVFQRGGTGFRRRTWQRTATRRRITLPSQGLVQAMGCIYSTPIVICTATAVMILLSGVL